MKSKSFNIDITSDFIIHKDNNLETKVSIYDIPKNITLLNDLVLLSYLNPSEPKNKYTHSGVHLWFGSNSYRIYAVYSLPYFDIINSINKYISTIPNYRKESINVVVDILSKIMNGEISAD